jgi:RNA polymerase sigma factor (sigma-70 family)
MDDPGGDDRTLLLRVRAGDDDAFTELYERHVGPVRRLAWTLTRNAAEAEDLVAESFFRVLRVVRRGHGPVDNARPYLLTVARRVASEWSSRRSEIPVEDLAASDNAPLEESDDSSRVELEMLARAFRSLPPRWQRVLWHVEVEGEGPSSVAPILGLTPNATAALAHRAREGLRAAYVQAHLREQERPLDCQPVVAKLGAYSVGRLRRRDVARVRAHLAWCPSCRNLHAELDEVGAALRVDLGALLAAAGLIAGVSGGGAATVGALASGASTGAASGSGIGSGLGAVSSGALSSGAAATAPVAVPAAAAATSAAAAGGVAVGVKSLVVAASVAAVGLFGLGPGASTPSPEAAAGCAVSCAATNPQAAGTGGSSAADPSGSDPAHAQGPQSARPETAADHGEQGNGEDHGKGRDHGKANAKNGDMGQPGNDRQDQDNPGADQHRNGKQGGNPAARGGGPGDSTPPGRRDGQPPAGKPKPAPGHGHHAGHGSGRGRPGDKAPPHQKPPGGHGPPGHRSH